MIARFNRRLDDRRDSGFTLIELLIVIVILGVLAAIVVFAIGSTRGDSVASSCKTNFKGVELSAEAVKTKSGVYPSELTSAGVAVATPFLDDATITTTTTGAEVASAGKSGNPVVAEAINVAPTTDVPFANGALLKQYPTSGDYALRYTPVLSGNPAKATGYTLVVGKLSSAGAFTQVTAGSPAVAVAGVAGCDAL